MEIKHAKKENARDLAQLINIAGEGIPEYLWRRMIEADESWLDVGIRRAAGDESGFSYTNARICMENNTLLGMLIAYKQPDPYLIEDLSEYPDIVQPLIELESRAAGSWYINAIATYENHRGKGVARKLLADTQQLAIMNFCQLMSLIVASDNVAAKKLYEYRGFQTIASLPIIPYPGSTHNGDWILMTCKVNQQSQTETVVD